MSGFYKPHRNQNWNYGGGRWKLSRSKIDLFKSCPLCFYVDNKLGTARPPGFPFNLNSAVDALFKKEFDIYRATGTPHPLMQKYGIDAVPFQHPNMDTWRENFEGIIIKHVPTGFTVSGAVDDIWVNPQGELIVVDYKSTSKDETPNIDAPWQDGYKRQMEVYQWLLRKSGFKVSNTGYFVYANGLTNKEKFNARLDFNVTVLPYIGSDTWIESTLLDIKKTLEGGEIPQAARDCDYCTYREAFVQSTGAYTPVEQVSEPQSSATPPVARKTEPSKKKPSRNATLF